MEGYPYAGNQNYSAKTKKFFPVIPKATPTITLTQEGNDVIATVSGNATGKVTFIINGLIKENITVNGNATLKDILEIGNNYVVANYNGDDNYLSNFTSAVFNIDKKCSQSVHISIVGYISFCNYF